MKLGSEQDRKKTAGRNQPSQSISKAEVVRARLQARSAACARMLLTGRSRATRPAAAGEYFCGESEDERKKPSETAVCTAGAAACRPCPWRAWVRQERMDGPEPDDSAGACTHLDNPSSLRCKPAGRRRSAPALRRRWGTENEGDERETAPERLLASRRSSN